MNNLARCPFCGDSRCYVSDSDGQSVIRVQCRGCGAQMLGHKRHFSSFEEAIAAWNRRAPAGAAEPVAWAAGDWLRAITETELAGIPNTGKDKGRRDRCRSMYLIPLFCAPQPSPEQAALLAEVEGLRKAGQRVIDAFTALGNAMSYTSHYNDVRRECEAAMLALDAALSTKEREHG